MQCVASHYISNFSTIRRGDRLYLWVRVSKGQNRGHLRWQIIALIVAAMNVRAIVVGVFTETLRRKRQRGRVGQGWGDSHFSALEAAAALAREDDAKLVATETDRFVRHPDFRSNEWPSKQAGKEELDMLQKATQGVELVTLTDPDATPDKCKSEQTKRSPKNGRPPNCKDDLIVSLYKVGYSQREIENIAGVPRWTVRRKLGLS